MGWGMGEAVNRELVWCIFVGKPIPVPPYSLPCSSFLVSLTLTPTHYTLGSVGVY